MTDESLNLPELPNSYGDHCVADSVRVMREPGYTAAQLRDYALAAIALNRRTPQPDKAGMEAHSTEDNYQHFLAYSGLPHSGSLRYAYFHGADADCDRPATAQEDGRDALLRFAADVLDYWPDGAPDGGDLQELAVKHGLLIATPAVVPCGENCACTEFYDEGDTADCYHRAPWLTALSLTSPDSGKEGDRG